MAFESKYGLFEEEEGAENAEAAIDNAIDTFIETLRDIDENYPLVGMSDTVVREAVVQEIINNYPRN